jgi:hypothetical protein
MSRKPYFLARLGLDAGEHLLDGRIECRAWPEACRKWRWLRVVLAGAHVSVREARGVSILFRIAIQGHLVFLDGVIPFLLDLGQHSQVVVGLRGGEFLGIVPVLVGNLRVGLGGRLDVLDGVVEKMVALAISWSRSRSWSLMLGAMISATSNSIMKALGLICRTRSPTPRRVTRSRFC